MGWKMNNLIKRIAAIALISSCGIARAANFQFAVGENTMAHEYSSTEASAQVIISGPNGFLLEQKLNRNVNRFAIPINNLADGDYAYQISFEYMANTNSSSADEANQTGDFQGRASAFSNAPLAPAPRPIVGHFKVIEGAAFLRDANLAPTRQDATAPKKLASQAKDVVVPDDQIVQGSGCFGFDCINNESFGFDTIRLKENNTRIKFEDTSAAGFPAADWFLVANDSASGGQDQFSIENVSAVTVPFKIVGAAPSNSLIVDNFGRLGLKTATPVLDLHLATTNTPAHRFEQTSAGGFTAQTWDVAGNEANFFIRDVTGGSRLPFRIRPGAPTSSIDIAADGDVGVGTASPGAKLDVSLASPSLTPINAIRVQNSNVDFAAATDRFIVDSSGNVTARGVIAQQSSRESKTDFASINAKKLMGAISNLEFWHWRYKDAATGDIHLGPVAEDFFAAFGLGTNNKVIAPADMAGVALAAVQALQTEVAERDQKIEALELRLQALETLLNTTH